MKDITILSNNNSLIFMIGFPIGFSCKHYLDALHNTQDISYDDKNSTKG